MHRTKTAVWVGLVFCILSTASVGSANEMQRQILDTSINLGWVAGIIDNQGKTAENMGYLTTSMNNAAGHVRAVMGLLRPPYTGIDLSGVLNDILNWDSRTASLSRDHAVVFITQIYERLRSLVSVFVDGRTNRLTQGPNCDRHFAEVGFFFGRANIAAITGNAVLMNQYLTAMRQAVRGGLTQAGLKACGFGRQAEWDGLLIFSGSTSREAFEATRERIQAITREAGNGGGIGGQNVQPNAQQNAAAWAGVWRTNWGDMVLSVSGNQVTGTYSFENGRISGTVSGNVLEGTWAQDNRPQGGSFRWEISRDGRSWSGQWNYAGDAAWQGTWTGSR